MVLLCPQRAPATTDPCRTPKLGAGPDSLNVIGNCWVVTKERRHPHTGPGDWLRRKKRGLTRLRPHWVQGRVSHFRLETGILCTPVPFGYSANNLDGARRGCIRYDTPECNGSPAAVAYGQNILSSSDDYFDITFLRRYLRQWRQVRRKPDLRRA